MTPVDRIRAAFERADRVDFEEGLVAFERYNETLQGVAMLYERPLPNVVAAFCALSPNNTYDGNLRSLISLLKENSPHAPVTTFHHCRERAWGYLHGEPFLTPGRGKKISNFYLNILCPEDPHPITIDGHMVNVHRGEVRPLYQALAGRHYDRIAEDFRGVAREAGLRANQLQAIVWFVWKRINRIGGVHQLGLFSQGDQWKTRRAAETIEGFRRFEG